MKKLCILPNCFKLEVVILLWLLKTGKDMIFHLPNLLSLYFPQALLCVISASNGTGWYSCH